MEVTQKNSVRYSAQLPEAQFFSVREVAAILNLSKSAVSQAIKRGRIPAIRVSCWPLVPKSWVEDTIAESQRIAKNFMEVNKNDTIQH
jgi:excisionase family DNA binding protein